MEKGKFYISTVTSIIVKCDIPSYYTDRGAAKGAAKGEAFGGEIVSTLSHDSKRKGVRSDRWATDNFRELTGEEIKKRKLEFDLGELGF